MYNEFIWINEFNWFQLIQIKLKNFSFLLKFFIQFNIFKNRYKNTQNSNFLKNIHM